MSKIVVVNRTKFTVKVYNDGHGTPWQREKTYIVAVGVPGHETPEGIYSVLFKERNPDWNVPDEDWAGALRTMTIPAGDPRNPLKGAFIGIGDGVGFHGTDNIDSLGTAASHGCIRMSLEDINDLYTRIGLDTPVEIGG